MKSLSKGLFALTYFVCLLNAPLQSLFNQAEAAELTCTASMPCSLADLLIPGNFFKIDNGIFAPFLGQEIMTFSNFDALVGDFGGSSISVWGEEWRLVMAPNASNSNPWKIVSGPPFFPDVRYLSTLQYDVTYNGFQRYFDEYFRLPLVGGSLRTEFGEFANAGGVSIEGSVNKAVTNNSDLAVDMQITCQDLEVNFVVGCQNQEGYRSVGFKSAEPIYNITVLDTIDLEYIGILKGGGTLEVNKIVNGFNRNQRGCPEIGCPGDPLPEPSTLILFFSGFGVMVLFSRASSRRP